MKAALLIVLLCSLSFCQQTYDVVLYGGKIVDGTGNQWFYGDLAISGNRIAKITRAGALNAASAQRRIDVHGLVVAPSTFRALWVGRPSAKSRKAPPPKSRAKGGPKPQRMTSLEPARPA